MKQTWKKGRGHHFGIDFGSSMLRIYTEEEGLLLEEPAVVARERGEDPDLIYFGKEALRQQAARPGELLLTNPMEAGILSEFDLGKRLLAHMLQRLAPGRVRRPKLVFVVPCGISAMAERALLELSEQSGGGKTYLIESPLAAALGADWDIAGPAGQLVIDIGRGSCDMAVIALGSVVLSRSTSVAGEAFDRALIRYVRDTKQLIIGQATAEKLKRELGSLQDEEGSMVLRGRDLSSGLPQDRSIPAATLTEPLREVAEQLTAALDSLLEDCPPDLVRDIGGHGLLLVGGGSLLPGLATCLESHSGIAVHTTKAPTHCGVRGAALALGR